MKSFFDQAYGPDNNLINGIVYLEQHPVSRGHPFLGEDRFYTGKVMINSQVYQDVELKYDVHNQKVILQYRSFSGGLNQIVLMNHLIDGFEIDGKIFRRCAFPETNLRFFQVVTEGEIYCLYHWQKNLKHTSSYADSYYMYMPEKRSAYLVMDGRLLAYGGRRSFLKLFPEDCRKDIKRFLSSNSIRLKISDDHRMQALMDFCFEFLK